jgi:hypothetical protein
MKKKILFLLLTLCQNIFAEEISSNTKEIMTVENFTSNEECKSHQKIEGREYCVKRSNITLNSCGPLSDWPCMEEQGCLIIDKFTLKD